MAYSPRSPNLKEMMSEIQFVLQKMIKKKFSCISEHLLSTNFMAGSGVGGGNVTMQRTSGSSGRNRS
jgi:hypothetical protein